MIKSPVKSKPAFDICLEPSAIRDMSHRSFGEILLLSLSRFRSSLFTESCQNLRCLK